MQRNSIVIFAVCLLAVGPARAGVVAPLAGHGDFSFSADVPVFPTTDGARVDLALQIYNPELHFAPVDDGTQVAVVEVAVKVARRGLVAHETVLYFELRESTREDALAATQFQILDHSFEVTPGRWAITLRARDLGRERAQMVASLAAESVATGTFDVPEYPDDRPRLSDLEFRLDHPVSVPNPERLYGINQDTLVAYVEVDRVELGADMRVDVRVLDPLAGATETIPLRLEPRADRSAALFRLPLGTFPEGVYELEVVPSWWPEGATIREFGVSWRMDRLVQSSRDVWVEGILMLEGEDLDTFQRLSRPAQLDMLERFWSSVDPTPETSENELYTKFKRRLAHAERHFGTSRRHGALTDRGRIYVRYGPPDATSVEVVPLNADELDEAIEQVHNIHHIEQQSNWNKESIIREPTRLVNERRDQREIADRRRNLASVGREGSFELWEYSLLGDPLLPDYAGWTEDVDLRFLFVDRLGSGDYSLEFSNMPTKY